MTGAEKILIIAGVASLWYAVGTGAIITLQRMKRDTVSKYLTYAHIGPLFEGAILLGLVFALRLSPLSDGIETAAAILVAGSAAMLALAATSNWLLGVKDEFRPPRIGFALDTLSVVLLVPGLAIIAVGVLQGA